MRGRERRHEKNDVEKEMAKIEREAMKQYLREDVAGMPGNGAASSGAPVSAEHAARLAELEDQMARDRLDRSSGADDPDGAGLADGWEASTNPDGKTYYLHSETGEVQWERPQRAGGGGGDTELPTGWEASTNPDGKTYYTHNETGAVQWERPRRAGGRGSASASADATATTAESGRNGWEQGWTPEGVVYYYNRAKEVTQWEAPDECVMTDSAAEIGAEAGTSEGDPTDAEDRAATEGNGHAEKVDALTDGAAGSIDASVVTESGTLDDQVAALVWSCAIT